jgi:hypothetical protein
MFAEVAQTGALREHVPDEFLRGQGDEYLATMASSKEPGQAVQPGSEIVSVLGHGGGRMEGHPHPQGSHTFWPRLLQ